MLYTHCFFSALSSVFLLLSWVSNVSAQEEYSDIYLNKYMQDIADKSPTGAFEVDLSDPEQYAFLLARFKQTGKNAIESPHFFRVLENTRQEHISKSLIQPDVFEILGGFKNEDHLITTFKIEKDQDKFFVSAFSTVHGGSNFTFLDVSVFDENNSIQLTPIGTAEEYNEGAQVVATTSGNLPSEPKVVTVNSLEKTEINGITKYHFISHKMLLKRGIDYDIVIDAPKDKNLDKVVQVCLSRNHSDCDYSVFGQNYMKVPFKGAIRLPYKINKEDVVAAGTYIKLSAAKSGADQNGGNVGVTGGTGELVWDDGSGEQTFTSRLEVTESPGDSTLITWDIPQELAWFKSEKPYGNLAEVNWYLHITVNAKVYPNIPLTYTIRTVATSDQLANESTEYKELFPPLTFRWSCLAQGTQVKMANGDTKQIEDISYGEKVRANAMDLTLVDLSIGEESKPMIRIIDDKHNSLLLTRTHPIMTKDQGMLWASELSVGDQVFTEKWLPTLVVVSQEVFADGFLVGDLAMQSDFTFREEKKDVLQHLPKEWHIDYLNSLKH